MELLDLIAQGEHQQQDFKYKISSIAKIAHSVSAFANTDGGRLLVGVRDNGRIAGIASEEEIYMIEGAANTYCKPKVECHMETVEENGHTVLVATVPKSDSRPVMAKCEDGMWRAYVRVADENIVASAIHLELWRQETSVLGELQPFNDLEQHYMQIIADAGENGILLNRFCRLSHLQRHRAIQLMARWIRFDLLQMLLQDHKWVIKFK